MSTLFGVPVDAAYHLVFTLTNVLTPVLGGLAAVAGIILVTMAVRLLVSPLTFRALRGQAAQTRLAPEVQRLRQRYAKQPDRLQRELTALYQREGTSMFAGFAPLLVQWPVFSVLYLLFRSPTVAGGPNRLLSRNLLGVPLGSHWLSGAGILSVHGVVFLGVLAVLAAACWLAARAARRALPQPALQPGSGQRGPFRCQLPLRGLDASPGHVAQAAPGRRLAGRARPRRLRQDRPVHHGGDRGLRAPGGRDLPGHLDRLERGRAPGLRGQVESATQPRAARARPRGRSGSGRRRPARQGGRRDAETGTPPQKIHGGPRRRPRSLGARGYRLISPIRRLEPGDLKRCVALSVDRGWSPERSKWSLLLAASEAFGVDAPDGRGLAGAVVLTRWGPDLASVGMMLVAARYGRRGLGRALMEHVIAEAGEATVTLFATDMGRPLYEKLGFQPVRRIVSFVGPFRPGRPTPASRPRPAGFARAAAEADLPAILAVDRAAFGADRGRVLTRLPGFADRIAVLDRPRQHAFAATRRPGGIPRRRPSSARWSPPTPRRPSSSSRTWPPTRTAPSA